MPEKNSLLFTGFCRTAGEEAHQAGAANYNAQIAINANCAGGNLNFANPTQAAGTLQLKAGKKYQIEITELAD